MPHPFVRASALVLTLALLPARATLDAQPPAAAAPRVATGTIVGRVVAAGSEEPLVGATVRVLLRGMAASDDPVGDTPATATGAPATQADAEGRFTLRGVPAGVVRLEVRRIGYAPTIRTDVVVSPAKAVEVLVALTPAAAQLTAVTVRPTAFPTIAAPSFPVSTNSFAAEEVRRAPGVQEDVVRAVSVLPGVGVTTAGRNDLVVRGGAPFENLFVVDNVEVPNINHFGTQGSTGGPISLVNIDFVQEATLSAGGFGVRYGDRTASVTTIRLREGARERVSGELNLSATGAGLIGEGPLGGAGSFLVGVRRSYLDLVFDAVGFSFVPAYTDLTLKAAWRPSPRDQLSFLTIGAVGRVTLRATTADDRFENSRVVAPQQDQYFSGLTWRRTLARGGLTTTLGRTWTRFATVQNDSGTATRPPAPIFRADTREGETSLRADLTLQATPRAEVEAGAIAKHAGALRYDLLLPGDFRRDAAGVPRPLRVDTSFGASRAGAYAQGTTRLGERVRLTLGARADHWAFLRGATRLAPRGALAFQPDAATTLALSAGSYWQAPPLLWLAGDPSNARTLAPFRADQVVGGWTRILRPDLKVQVEAYAKRYAAYPARVFRPQAVLQPAGFDDVTNDIPFGLEPVASTGTGDVVGAELLVQKKLSEVPVYGLLSVSANRTRFTGLDGRSALGAFDVPLLANALLGWRPSARWELSGRVRTATGLPTTPFVTMGADAGALDFARYNAGPRLPTFFTLDVRVDRRWQLGGTQLITYLDVQNATGRQNVSRFEWDPRRRLVAPATSIGVLPSIGVNWEF